jgi:hypothetical protein
MTERRKIGQELARRVRLASVVLEENGRLRAEIARMRFTDAERFTLREVRDIYANQDDDPQCGEIAAVIDGLLERLG